MNYCPKRLVAEGRQKWEGNQETAYPYTVFAANEGLKLDCMLQIFE